MTNSVFLVWYYSTTDKDHTPQSLMLYFLYYKECSQDEDDEDEDDF